MTITDEHRFMAINAAYYRYDPYGIVQRRTMTMMNTTHRAMACERADRAGPMAARTRRASEAVTTVACYCPAQQVRVLFPAH